MDISIQGSDFKVTILLNHIMVLKYYDFCIYLIQQGALIQHLFKKRNIPSTCISFEELPKKISIYLK
jgi:hypothetical protein